jgi:hypothetical protein
LRSASLFRLGFGVLVMLLCNSLPVRRPRQSLDKMMNGRRVERRVDVPQRPPPAAFQIAQVLKIHRADFVLMALNPTAFRAE